MTSGPVLRVHLHAGVCLICEKCARNFIRSKRIYPQSDGSALCSRSRCACVNERGEICSILLPGTNCGPEPRCSYCYAQSKLYSFEKTKTPNYHGGALGRKSPASIIIHGNCEGAGAEGKNGYSLAISTLSGFPLPDKWRVAQGQCTTKVWILAFLV